MLARELRRVAATTTTASSSRRPMTSSRRRALTLDPRSLDGRDDHDTDCHQSLSFSLSLSVSHFLSRSQRALKICTKVRIRVACIPRDPNAKHCRSDSRAFLITTDEISGKPRSKDTKFHCEISPYCTFTFILSELGPNGKIRNVNRCIKRKIIFSIQDFCVIVNLYI